MITSLNCCRGNAETKERKEALTPLRRMVLDLTNTVVKVQGSITNTLSMVQGHFTKTFVKVQSHFNNILVKVQGNFTNILV